jgi:Putative beta-barrel porin-2, OmpL-like. bbp2
MNVGDTSLAFNFYGGPQSTPAVRWLFDAVATQKFGPHFAVNLNAIYGAEAGAKWYAAALQGKYTIGERVRLAARVEYFADPDGHRTGRSNAMYLDTTVGAGVIVLNDDCLPATGTSPSCRRP